MLFTVAACGAPAMASVVSLELRASWVRGYVDESADRIRSSRQRAGSTPNSVVPSSRSMEAQSWNEARP
jgi:hypothetical protein